MRNIACCIPRVRLAKVEIGLTVLALKLYDVTFLARPRPWNTPCRQRM